MAAERSEDPGDVPETSSEELPSRPAADDAQLETERRERANPSAMARIGAAAREVRWRAGVAIAGALPPEGDELEVRKTSELAAKDAEGDGDVAMACWGAKGRSRLEASVDGESTADNL